MESSSANPRGKTAFGSSHLPKTAGSTAGGGYGWGRGCGWLWMGFAERRSVVLALPLLKDTAVVAVGLSPPHPNGFCPFEQLGQCFEHSNTASNNATTPSHSAPCSDCFQHTLVLSLTQDLRKGGTTHAPPAPKALGGRNPPSFSHQNQLFRKCARYTKYCR